MKIYHCRGRQPEDRTFFSNTKAGLVRRLRQAMKTGEADLYLSDVQESDAVGLAVCQAEQIAELQEQVAQLKAEGREQEGQAA